MPSVWSRTWNRCATTPMLYHYVTAVVLKNIIITIIIIIIIIRTTILHEMKKSRYIKNVFDLSPIIIRSPLYIKNSMIIESITRQLIRITMKIKHEIALSFRPATIR